MKRNNFILVSILTCVTRNKNGQHVEEED